MKKGRKAKILGIGILATLLLANIVVAETQSREKANTPTVCSMQPTIEWEKTYGGDEADKFWYVQETDDGGYIACGTTEEADNHCPWVLKVDSDGNEMWDWTITGFDYGGTYVDIAHCWVDDVKQTADGGYIAGITVFLFDYNDERYGAGGLLKLDSNGVEEWMRIFGDPFEWQIGVEFIVEVDDGFMGVGSRSPPLNSNALDIDRDLCLFKTDSAGELIWSQEYDYKDESPDWARSFCSTDDGGYLIVGDTGEVAGNDWDAVMIKTDSNGNEEWHKTFGGSGGELFWNVFQTNDGGYMMGGGTSSFGAGNLDAWLLRTDATGNEQWNKTFGGKRMDLCYGGFDSTDDGGYIASIAIDVWGVNADGWILKIDSDGNVVWKHIYEEAGGQQSLSFIGMCFTSDGGCIASGMSGRWDASSSDALLVKFAAFENERPSKPAKPSGSERGTTGEEYAYTTSTSDADGDQVYYKWDWGDGNFSGWLDTPEASYTWSHDGSYSIRVMAKDEHGGESDWSDPLPVSMPKTYENPFWTLIEKLFGWLEQLFEREILSGIFNF